MKDDLVSNLRVACTHDDAVDWAHVDCGAYAGTLVTPGDRDPDRIKPMPGKSITWFHLRPISAGAFAAWCEVAQSMELRYVRSFQYAVDCIEALEIAGSAWRPRSLVPDVMGRDVALIDDVELEFIRRTLGMPWIYEVGRVAYQRAVEGNIRGGGVKYTLPPSSLVASNRNALLHAEWIRTSQQENKEKSAEQSPPRLDAD